jgi:uncharacterized protein (TIGR03085 family)
MSHPGAASRAHPDEFPSRRSFRNPPGTPPGDPYDHVVSFARDERAALCALLDETGPDAPTLCAGWATRDLAAHLVLRERRPDAALGIMVRPLAGYAASVQRRVAARPYGEVVDMIRHGPPRLSIWRIPGADEQGNSVEYFVHHEDVRRAAPGTQPRELGASTEDLLWHRLRLARFILRSAPCGVILQRDGTPRGEDGTARGENGTIRGAAGTERITAKPGTPAVTVTGAPGELTLWALGRTSAAQVRLDGDETALRQLDNARWTL